MTLVLVTVKVFCAKPPGPPAPATTPAQKPALALPDAPPAPQSCTVMLPQCAGTEMVCRVVAEIVCAAVVHASSSTTPSQSSSRPFAVGPSTDVPAVAGVQLSCVMPLTHVTVPV